LPKWPQCTPCLEKFPGLHTEGKGCEDCQICDACKGTGKSEKTVDGKCPSCGGWGTRFMLEEKKLPEAKKPEPKGKAEDADA